MAQNEEYVDCPLCGRKMEDIAGSKQRSKCHYCGYYYDCC